MTINAPSKFGINCTLGCEIKFSPPITHENCTLRTSERDHDFGSEESMRMIPRTLPLGATLSEIVQQTGAELFSTLTPLRREISTLKENYHDVAPRE